MHKLTLLTLHSFSLSKMNTHQSFQTESSYFILHLFQVRNHSSASLMGVTGGLLTPATERSTPTCTPRTSRTTARSGAATSPTPTPPAWGSTWRCTGRRRCGAASGTARTVTARSPPAAQAPGTASSSPGPTPASEARPGPCLGTEAAPRCRNLTSATLGTTEWARGPNMSSLRTITTPSGAL